MEVTPAGCLVCIQGGSVLLAFVHRRQNKVADVVLKILGSHIFQYPSSPPVLKGHKCGWVKG